MPSKTNNTTQKNRTQAARARIEALGASIPQGATIVRQRRTCGKKGCEKLHGPYWFAYWKDTKTQKTRGAYIGSDTRLADVLKRRADLRKSAAEHDTEENEATEAKASSTKKKSAAAKDLERVARHRDAGDRPIMRWTPTKNGGARGRTQKKGRIYSITVQKTTDAFRKKGYGPRSYSYQSTTAYGSPFKTMEDAQKAAESYAKAGGE